MGPLVPGGKRFSSPPQELLPGAQQLKSEKNASESHCCQELCVLAAAQEVNAVPVRQPAPDGTRQLRDGHMGTSCRSRSAGPVPLLQQDRGETPLLWPTSHGPLRHRKLLGGLTKHELLVTLGVWKPRSILRAQWLASIGSPGRQAGSGL